MGSKFLSKLEGVFPQELSSLVKQLSDLPTNMTTEVGNSQSNVKVNITNDQKLHKLIQLAPVMLFMKGTPTEPRCGFSRKIVEILNQESIQFASFDILSDEEVRAGLKLLSDWPTYPQLYVNGTFVGGLDIIKDMSVTGNLKEQLGILDIQLPIPPTTLEERLKTLINQAPVVLFMKGDPSAPRCGFSRTIVDILNTHQV